MHVEIGTEAAQFQEKKYIIVIFVAMQFIVVSVFSLFHKIPPTFKAAKLETMDVWHTVKQISIVSCKFICRRLFVRLYL
jgi:hypothetical protein